MENNPGSVGEDPPPRRTASGRRHSSTRESILREIEANPGISTAALVEMSGMHENTVRGHLDGLLADGHVRRESAPSTGRGRPGWRWRAVEPARTSAYAGLAVSLASALDASSPQSAAVARAAGRDWGRRIVEDRDVRDVDPRDVVIEVMREQGFAPDADGDTIRLRACPLLSAASDNPSVVCAVHEGMAEGIARASGSELQAVLTPFAADGTCHLLLRVRR